MERKKFYAKGYQQEGIDSKIRKILLDYQEGDELEIRVGYFDDRYHFHSDITSFMFQYILKRFSSMDFRLAPTDYQGFAMDRQIQTVYMHKTEYSSERVKTIVSDDEIVTISKMVKKNEDFHGMGLRASLSREKIVEEEANLSKLYSKERIRTSFRTEEGGYQIDLTVDEQNRKYHYQLEIEFLRRPSEEELKNILFWADNLRKELYHNQAIAQEFNSNYAHDPAFLRTDRDIPYPGGPMPKNLKPFLVPFLHEYVIHSKPNGVSFFLYFSLHQGIYYINKTEIFLASKNAPPQLRGSILLGEFLDNNFYAYDFLIYQRKDVRALPMTQRHSLLSRVQTTLRWDNFKIIPIFYTKDLYRDLAACFNYISMEWNKESNDGIVLKPENLSFASQYIYKWKPLYHTSIDLNVRQKGDRYFGYAYKEDLILFTGTDEYPYSGEVSLGKFPDAPENSILEFTYDFEREILVANRPRLDKIKPNFIGVAKSIWEDIKDPLTDQDLLRLSRNVISPGDSLITIAKKVCIFLKQTKNPLVFSQLSKYLGTDVITQLFRGGAYMGKQKNLGNELVPLLVDYFSKK